MSLRMPGAPSLVFLAYILLLLPWAAYRSGRRFREAQKPGASRPLPSRERIGVGVLASQAGLLGLAWWTGRGFGFEIFAVSRVGSREVLASLLALGVSLALRATVRAGLRLPGETRRQLAVYMLAPRTAHEWVLCMVTVLVGSVAEEAAYRGVGMAIVWYSTGSVWVAVFVCAMAFAIAHSVQGTASVLVIFAMALVMHALVLFTQSLIFAIVVHGTYDLVAGWLIARDARRLDQPS